MRDVEGSIDELRAVWGLEEPAMHKRSADLQRYLVLFRRVRPAVVVETGLLFGGSQHWLAQHVPWVITVEKDPAKVEDHLSNAHGLGWPRSNTSTVVGDSADPAVLAQVRFLVARHGGHTYYGPAPVVVILDSDHSTAHVLAEMVALEGIVTVGSYMVVEDGLLHYLPQRPGAGFHGRSTPHNWYDGDPLLAIDLFLTDPNNARSWHVDEDLEDLFPTTQHPRGWLRRLR